LHAPARADGSDDSTLRSAARYGPKRTSPTTGRLAGTIHPSNALVEFLGKHDDEQQLQIMVRSFIERRIEESRAAVRRANKVP
jgi:hypothetical protein